jgi:hypothetical protein
VRYLEGKGVRGQRTSRHRHHRKARRVVLGFALVVMLAVAAWRSVPRQFGSSEFSRANRQNSLWLQGSARDNLALLAGQSQKRAPAVRPGRLIYPYSIIPGGVQDPYELERASVRDRIVSQHFAGFDYQRAKVVRLDEAKLVYLSYRMHNRVFWTRKKVRLARGENLISDGKIMARTRCGNQVSEKAQKAISPEEPPTMVFDQPMKLDGGTATQIPFPAAFESALLTRPQFPGLDPAVAPGPNSPLSFIPGGGWFPPVFPPAISSGGCETSAEENLETKLGIVDDEKKEKHCPSSPSSPPPGRPPAPVPEPGTILLVSSGLAGLYLRYRAKLPRS